MRRETVEVIEAHGLALLVRQLVTDEIRVHNVLIIMMKHFFSHSRNTHLNPPTRTFFSKSPCPTNKTHLESLTTSFHTSLPLIETHIPQSSLLFLTQLLQTTQLTQTNDKFFIDSVCEGIAVKLSDESRVGTLNQCLRCLAPSKQIQADEKELLEKIYMRMY